jgi:type VI secretion system secreted protein VgrG
MAKFVTITSPVGNDVFELIRLEGCEKFSSLYSFQLTLRYQGKTLQPADIVGKVLTVTLNLASQQKRYFSGIVARFGTRLQQGELVYQLELVPQLWRLQFNRNSRIFQQKSVKDILNQILQERGIACNTNKLSGNYPTLEYCVQFQESDFAFISRLMEQVGIFYYFEYQQNAHQLVLADSNNVYVKGISQAQTISPGMDYPQITGWAVDYNFYAGKHTVNHHDFINPNKQLIASSKALKTVAGNEQYEIYQYPAGHLTTEAGNQLSKVAIQQQEQRAILGHGSSTYSELMLGGKLSFDSKQLPAEQGNSYVITELCHSLDYNSTNQLAYHNEFNCILASATFRPAPLTLKPAAPSMQLATVVGPSGKEIYTDSYGRMKVQFLWDREGKANEKSSCWMRAVQQWEGLLRIGTPVVVGFVDGDLDNPLILGPVYNANLMPVYALEDNQTKSSLKRRHIKKAEEKTYNEIAFEDKKDQQQLYMHATKDLLIEVENAATHHLKKGDLTITVDKGKCIIKVKGDVSLQTDGGLTVNAAQAINLNSKQDINFSGNNIKLEAKMNVQLKAGAQLSQKAMEINSNATAKIALKAPLQTIQSDGLLTLKGGLIKEN